jgi:hypothetical protein
VKVPFVTYVLVSLRSISQKFTDRFLGDGMNILEFYGFTASQDIGSLSVFTVPHPEPKRILSKFP